MTGQGATIAGIWAAALLLWLAFLLFYDGIRRPLRREEIDAFLATLGPRMAETGNDAARLRAFLEADDGREFVMVNLVGTRAGPVTDPDSGETREGSEWLRRYSDPFVRGLIARGGHPLFVGRKVGGYIDAWNVPADPGWSLVGTMRYRSRRDLIRMASDPAFRAAHPAKLLGIATTFSFPTQRQIAFYASPRVTMGLLLGLLAALAHIAVLTIG
ncbi:MAG: hypothetical protein JNN10_05550 [Sphingopyxis sp.]|uniref:hypothetical protein n=1 Tax=Sphingopyxis sp. TaxID=1908224 RepID=UPI001A3AFA9E|nr:hypothetical protein [Sphingopyxis sp.]MBL9065737.1 hypothetical protein [Sphingopyxis sp.]